MPKAAITDQGGPNQGLSREFTISQEKNFIDHKIKDANTDNFMKLLFLWDTPLLTKSIRKEIVKYEFKIGEKIDDWKYIEKLYKLDLARGYPILNKITHKPIHPNEWIE